MKIEEAIAHAKEQTEIFAGKHRVFLYLAIEALERQMPKKPILNNPKIDEFYVKEAKLCPVCHGYINDCSGDYCRDCGQRIDFGKEE